MSDFPSGIYAPRTIENRPGVIFDEEDTKTLYKEDIEAINNEIIALEQNFPLLGWTLLSVVPTLQASDDPTYTLRFNANMTATIGLGQKIKLTQHATTKYFIVVKVGAYTGGNTDIEVYGGTDYDMENTGTYPVASIYFSTQKAPFDFPLSPVKWTVEILDNQNRVQANPVNGTWYNATSINVPIGLWDIQYLALGWGKTATSNNYPHCKITLSTANNSQSDADFTTRVENNLTWTASITSIEAMVSAFCRKIVALTTKATLYMNYGVETTNQTYAGIVGSNQSTIIRAICAYL